VISFNKATTICWRVNWNWNDKNHAHARREKRSNANSVIHTIYPFNNYVIWPGSLALMNHEPITLRNLLMRARLQDQKVWRNYRKGACTKSWAFTRSVFVCQFQCLTRSCCTICQSYSKSDTASASLLRQIQSLTSFN
jgi:hypothetical protein